MGQSKKYGYYIAGFTDGEGSFNVSLIKRKDYAEKWKIVASFNISQRDKTILLFIKRFLCCGTLRQRKDGVIYYEVTKIADLQKKIIPFFQNFQFLSSNKKRNFSIFAKIVNLLYKKEHLTPRGFKKIIQLRENLNEGRGRKRKYSLKDVLKIEESPETIRKNLLKKSRKIRYSPIS